MEMDELANSEEDIKSNVLPFIRPGFDRRQEKTATPPRPPRPPRLPRLPHTPQTPSAQLTQLEQSSSLGTWQYSEPPKTNGSDSKYSVKSIPQPVVVIPLVDRPTLSASRVPLAVSASSLALYTPKKYKVTKSSDTSHPKSTTGGLNTPNKSKLPSAAVGRRSKQRSDTRPKRDRAKSTSYREVAVHDESTYDTNYSPHSPESHVLSRVRKRERSPSRARLPERPKARPRQSLSYRKVVRAPIQSTEAIQRSIFVASEAHFAPFVCEWAGCRAELQNMETLRRHVAIVHSKSLSTVQTCRWRGCAAGVAAMHHGDGAVTDAVTDADCRTFLEHVEHQHLSPLAWLQGDGFANAGHIAAPKLPPATVLATKSRVRSRAKSKANGKDKRRTINPTAVVDSESSANTAVEISFDTAPSESLPRYLLDERGQQVTPLLRDTVLESSSVLWTQEERERRLKYLYRQQQQSLNQRPSRDLERIM
ncbi:hypothetical protein SEPCBS57363_005477 [Sporothrix epigloea]|uniref:C2H2-type domain-containing protein n=1 Tax=Sporothrix epigloea TaxID=1892477 RepID=A0ABP0E0S5_9PEZI